MKKTVSASTTSLIPFVRVRDLSSHIEVLINGQLERGTPWDDDKFNKEIWIKMLVSLCIA